MPEPAAERDPTAEVLGPAYAERLARTQSRAWKRWAPNPYRAFLRRLDLGLVLDVGCGLGRSLGYLDGHGAGIDPNEVVVARARAAGFDVSTPEQFRTGPHRSTVFDSMLCAHVLEHLDEPTGVALLRSWLPWIRPGGTVVLITPQERGQRSDPTHVRFVDDAGLRRLADAAGIGIGSVRSFPFPRPAGKVFVYNETVLLGTAPSP
jgi:SAM-dependent methyltransferase